MQLNIFRKLVFGFIFSYSTIFAADVINSEIRWNWSGIDLENMENFKPLKKLELFGTAICEYQNSGATNLPNTNWAEWEKGTHKDGKPHIHGNQKSGVACDFWNECETNIDSIIALMKNLKVNSFRFSIDWSKIEPQKDVFDKTALDHYEKLCDALIKAGITPVATLHHFVHPAWFEKLGGFENVWNIRYFLRFSQYVFERLATKIPIWCTINEPGIYASQGFSPFRGVTPPGKKDFALQGRVLENLLKAHVRVYRALKAMPNGENVKIGIVHNILQFEPFHDNTLNPANQAEQILCNLLNHTFHKSVTEFFRTGVFKYSVSPLIRSVIECSQTGNFRFSVPFEADFEYKEPDAKKTLDFFGLNYYSHVLLNILKFDSVPREGDIMTDMQYTIYAEGFYRAIKEASLIGVPIYITENGIADDKDDKRAIWIKRYLYALSRAISEGADVRGYFYWSLMDNFEWDEGRIPRFGLYEVNFDTQERKLREGSKALINIIESVAQA
jgi:beta-glucosidase